MDIDIKRLEWDAAYWDQVGHKGFDFAFVRSGRVIFWSSDDHRGSFVGEVIPRPKPQSSEWDGEGAKHVGMKFQTSLGECELMAIDSNKVTCCVRFLADGHLQFCRLDALEQIRTQAEREKEELTKVVAGALDDCYVNGGFSPSNMITDSDTEVYSEAVAEAVVKWMRERNK